MRKIFALGFCALLLAVPPAAAQDCPPLKQLAAIKLERTAPDGPFLVPVRINGVAKTMLLTTGFPVSRIYLGATEDLKLPMSQKPLVMGGSTYGTTNQVHVDSLIIGSAQFTSSDLPTFAGTPPFGFAGLLGMDILSHFDVDLDLANGMLNLFDVNHCAGQVVYWKTDNAVALPIKYDLLGRIIMPVKLDGKPFTGLIDTVMPDSTMYLPALKKAMTFEISEADVAPQPSGANFLRHRFSTLELAGVMVTDPAIVLWDDKTYTIRAPKGPGPVTVLALGGGIGVVDQLAIGFNTLSKMHLYIAMKEKKLYISAATPPS